MLFNSHGLTLIVFLEKLGLAHPDLPVGLARRGCCVPPPLRESFAQLSAQLESSLQRTLFPNPPSGQVPNYCRFHLPGFFLQSEALSHWTINYFARLYQVLPTWQVGLSVWSRRFVFSERIPFVRHVAPRPGLHGGNCLNFQKVLVWRHMLHLMVSKDAHFTGLWCNLNNNTTTDSSVENTFWSLEKTSGMFLLGTKDNTGLVATHEERERTKEKGLTETERKERRLLVVVARELHTVHCTLCTVHCTSNHLLIQTLKGGIVSHAHTQNSPNQNRTSPILTNSFLQVERRWMNR